MQSICLFISIESANTLLHIQLHIEYEVACNLFAYSYQLNKQKRFRPFSYIYIQQRVYRAEQHLLYIYSIVKLDHCWVDRICTEIL